MIVRGDRLAESERVNRLSLAHAGLWALVLSNPKLLDDFGCMRWSEAQVVATVFPRRHPSPRRAVRSFMRAVEDAGLIEVHSVEGQDFAAVRNWCGVEPARRKYHRAPLPPSSTHVCGEHPCARDGARVASLWRQGPIAETPRDDDRMEAREDTRLSVPSVPPAPSGPPGSTNDGRIELKAEGRRPSGKANGRTCEIGDCGLPAVGATSGHYRCAVHDDEGGLSSVPGWDLDNRRQS